MAHRPDDGHRHHPTTPGQRFLRRDGCRDRTLRLDRPRRAGVDNPHGRSAVAGVGTTNRNSTVDWAVFRKMVVAWVVTMPAAAIVAAAVYGLTQLPSLAASTIVLAVLIAGLLVLLWKSLRAAPKAGDVEADLDKEAEEEFPMLAGAGSIIPSGKPRRRHGHKADSHGDTDAPGRDDAKAAKEAEQRKQLDELNKVTADQVPELSW